MTISDLDAGGWGLDAGEKLAHVGKCSIRNRVFVGDKGFMAISNRYHVRLGLQWRVAGGRQAKARNFLAHREEGAPAGEATGAKVAISQRLFSRGLSPALPPM